MVTQKRQAILKAAEEVFAKQGFNQIKVADIVKESQVHEASIYAYFKNKKNILFDICGDYVRTAVQGLKEHFQGMKEPGARNAGNSSARSTNFIWNNFCGRARLLALSS